MVYIYGSRRKIEKNNNFYCSYFHFFERMDSSPALAPALALALALVSAPIFAFSLSFIFFYFACIIPGIAILALATYHKDHFARNTAKPRGPLNPPPPRLQRSGYVYDEVLGSVITLTASIFVSIDSTPVIIFTALCAVPCGAPEHFLRL